MIKNSIEEWRLVVTWQHLVKLLCELIICAIHPIPGAYLIDCASPIDIYLSLPMFFRIYLAWRTFLHNTQINNTKVRVLGHLNHVEFKSSFVLKTLLAFHPIKFLFVSNFVIFLAFSWSLKLTETVSIINTCENNTVNSSIDKNSLVADFSTSMWLITGECLLIKLF